ncbi:MAG TPA: class I SAM-dependent methyltransferase [Pyrinomonadaceae bacterium]|nr:class I SAM-dependent methyltransferase [Pyrinomonadaceae bacterium]
MKINKSHFYDTIASEFDLIMNQYDLQRRLEVVFDELLKEIPLSGRKVLDAGCGTGYFSKWALDRGARVTSVDIGINLLREARKKGMLNLVAGDVMKLGFGDATFDVVISSECIEHTPSPETAVSEMVRVLRPGGFLVVTCPNRFWLWSCRLANALKIRPYRGLENWPSWGLLSRCVRENGIDIREHVGLHLFPFVLKPTHGLLRFLDRAGKTLGPLYVNQCLLGIKQSRSSA